MCAYEIIPNLTVSDQIIPENLLKIIARHAVALRAARKNVINYGTDSVRQVVHYLPRRMIISAIPFLYYVCHSIFVSFWWNTNILTFLQINSAH